MKLLVLGGTGGTGKHVIESALESGHEVTALVRDPAKVATKHDKLTVIKGNAASAADLASALAGKDAVISALGPRTKTDPICAEAAAALVEAAKPAGVRRIVWISASGVGDSRAAMNATSFVFGRIIIPLFLTKQYTNHERAENTLRASDLDWTVVRPLQLVDKSTGKPVTAQTGSGKVAGLKIARSDVARWLVEEAGARAHVRSTPMLFA
jgi:uncharacterized protein YbjT (DUF2867 family)